MRSLSDKVCVGALFLALAGCQSRTFVVVNVERGPATPDGTSQIELEVSLGDRTERSTYPSPDGLIQFPVNLGVEVLRGEGDVTATAIAEDQNGVELDRGTTAGMLHRHSTLELTVMLGSRVDPPDTSGAGPMQMTADRSSYDFGTVQVGSPGAVASFVVQNPAGAATTGTITTALYGTHAGEFAMDQDACTGRSLAPDGVCVVVVRMSPTSSGVKNATLSIFAGPGGEIKIQLTGNGVSRGPLHVEPEAQDFGNQAPGENSKSYSFAVTNSGQVVTGSPTVMLSGSDQKDFSIVSDGCSAMALLPGATCNVEVRFGPGSGGPKSAQLVVQAEPGGAAVVLLTGSALVPLEVTNNSIGTAVGLVTADKARIQCGSVCGDFVAFGTKVKLSAEPDADSVFQGWTGDCSGTDDCSLVMVKKRVLAANFITQGALAWDPLESTCRHASLSIL